MAFFVIFATFVIFVMNRGPSAYFSTTHVVMHR
jgi:hypothetical protein